VARVFDMAARLSGPAGQILFTYVHRGVLEGTFHTHGLARTFDMLARHGEAWTFGFVPEELPTYLSARGLGLRDDLGASEYRQLLWGEASRATTGYEFYRAARAEILGSGGPSHAAC
jgi:O-methyltransferase involved in polyketide biosynthesis